MLKDSRKLRTAGALEALEGVETGEARLSWQGASACAADARRTQRP